MRFYAPVETLIGAGLLLLLLLSFGDEGSRTPLAAAAKAACSAAEVAAGPGGACPKHRVAHNS
jgi:hypothetical protein